MNTFQAKKMRSSRPALRPASKPAPRWWFVWSRDTEVRDLPPLFRVFETTSRKLISLAFTNEDEDMLGATAWVLTWQKHAQPVPSNESKPLCRLTLRKLYVFGFLQPTTFARAKSAFTLRPRHFRNITTGIVIASGYKSCGSGNVGFAANQTNALWFPRGVQGNLAAFQRSCSMRSPSSVPFFLLTIQKERSDRLQHNYRSLQRIMHTWCAVLSWSHSVYS